MLTGYVVGHDVREDLCRKMHSVLLIIRLLSGLIDFPIVLDHGAAKTAPDGESVTIYEIKTRR